MYDTPEEGPGVATGGAPMRWAALVDDLGSLAAAWDRRDREFELADRTRGERARLELVNRLRRRRGEPVELAVIGAGRVCGEISRIGSDWILLGGAVEVVVPLGAVLTATDLAWGSVHQEGIDLVASRLSLGSVVRALASDRARVTVTLVDGSVLTGTPDSVGADFFDLAMHPADDAPRARTVSARVTISQGAVAAIARTPSAWSKPPARSAH